jgi:uncharacterized protein
VGRYGFQVIDADGHGGEPVDWRERIPDRFRSQMETFVARMKGTFRDLPGQAMQLTEGAPRYVEPPKEPLRFDPEGTRPGMVAPGPRIEDMDVEGIDVTVMFGGGAGEEWALVDPAFAAALCTTLNDARAEFCSFAPERLKVLAKVPMLDPEAAAAELQRCVTSYPGTFVGMSTTQHVRDRNLDDPAFDVVWATAERLGVAVCTHGGGQAIDQVPFGIERFRTRLEIHAMTHPLGSMLAVTNFTVGGILHRFPGLRVGFMESGVGWLPFWLERLDEHYELMADQAPAIDRVPSEYFRGRCFVGSEPEERMIPYVCESVGDDTVVYASDYCHFDCAFPNSVKLIAERDDLTDDQKVAILGGNAAKLYAIPLPVTATA